MYLRAIMLFLLMVGCNTNTIKGNSRRLPAGTAAASAPKVYIESSQIHATQDKDGNAILVVEAGQPMQVRCLDCPISLSFAPESGNAIHKADIDHRLVDKTYLCRVKLEVDYLAENVASKQIDYGLYFCPDRTDGSIHNRTRSCGDLSLATEGCPQ